MNFLWRQCAQKCGQFTYIQNFIRYTVHITKFSSFQQYLSTPKITSAECTFYSAIRHKSKKRREVDSDDEEEEYDDSDNSLSKDSKVMKVKTTSLRTDAVLKLALGVSRNRIEQLFYESMIRTNGKKIMKKSNPVKIDNEIDVIKGISSKNPQHILVSRIEILAITANEENIIITVRRFKNLLIENYENDPYKASTQSEE